MTLTPMYIHQFRAIGTGDIYISVSFFTCSIWSGSPEPSVPDQVESSRFSYIHVN